jgi:LemA protein
VERKRVVLLVLVGVVLLVGLGGYRLFVSTYNTLVGMDQAIKGQMAEIDNQLQRRADLIPNLVETVKGYAAHERQILEALANARARLAGARDVQGRLEANAELSSVLSRLLVIVENYPNLKADATFARLMDELAGTENRIAVARRRYNQAVQEFNTAVNQFPNRLLAGLYGFAERPFFEAPADAKIPPKVKF